MKGGTGFFIASVASAEECNRESDEPYTQTKDRYRFDAGRFAHVIDENYTFLSEKSVARSVNNLQNYEYCDTNVTTPMQNYQNKGRPIPVNRGKLF